MDDIIEKLDSLLDKHKQSRSYFPFMDERVCGKNISWTGHYYILSGYDVKLSFEEPINKEYIKKNNELADWMNQNFLIRLYSTIEEHFQLYGKNPKDHEKLKRSSDVESIVLAKRLRHVFAHSGSSKFDVDNSNCIKAKEIMDSVLDVTPIVDGRFNLAIDTVLEPLFNNCIKCIKEAIEIDE